MRHISYRLAVLVSMILLMEFSYGQKNTFAAGWVVLNNQDTVHGMVRKFKPDVASRRISFRDKYGILTNYYPKNVLSYMVGNDFYESKIAFRNSPLVGGPSVFMQLLDTGEASLYFYHYDMNSETSYQSFLDPQRIDSIFSDEDNLPSEVFNPASYDKDLFVAKPFSGDFYIERSGEVHQLVKSTGFRKKMKAFFENDHQLEQAIDGKVIRFRNVYFMAQVYNRLHR